VRLVLVGVVALLASGLLLPVSHASSSWNRLEGLAIDPTGTFAYVTNIDSGTVLRINLATNTVDATIIDGPLSQSVTINPAGTFAYVANWNTGTVSRINLATNTVDATITLNPGSVSVAINPTGTFAYVVNRNLGTVSRINLATNTVDATITVGLQPMGGVAINPAGTFAYIANANSGTVSRINLATNAVDATITVGGPPYGVAINPAGTFAYVTSDPPGTISKINLATNAVDATITVGSYPVRVAINPAGTFAYVTRPGAGTVSRINLATNAVDATITAGDDPEDVVINPAGTFAYVLNKYIPAIQTGTVSRINLATNTLDATISFDAVPLPKMTLTKLADPLLPPSPSASWLKTLNYYRVSSGLNPVTENPVATLGALRHATYLAKTNPSYFTGDYANLHTENPASPYYTQEGASSSSNVAWCGSESECIDAWMTGPFHAMGLMGQNLQTTGFALVSGVATLDVYSGLTGTQVPRAIAFPGNGAIIRLNSVMSERPDPRESCGSDWTTFLGLPLWVSLPVAPPKTVTAILTIPSGGKISDPRSICVVDQWNFKTTDPIYGSAGQWVIEKDHLILVIPKKPLEAGNNSVSITGAGMDTLSWSFKVNGMQPTNTTHSSQKKTIYCMKGKTFKKIVAAKPVCPKGYKQK